MTPIAQMECCTMLGIDPKTLRNWLRHAGMQFVAHPTDARLKCLTEAQVHQLATLHARPLHTASDLSQVPPEEVPPCASSSTDTAPAQKYEGSLISAVCSLSEEADLRRVVCGLETKVLALQEQLTQLAIELLHERSERYEQRLKALEALLPQHSTSFSSVQEPASDALPRLPHPSASRRPLQPAELRARSRVLPRIEYGDQGLYVLICPQEGVLSFPLDSPAWFDWLAALTSFRFLGPQGRFTAYREGQRSWRAYRTFHGRNHKQSLGTTDRLTIARLEQVATSLQAEITSLS